MPILPAKQDGTQGRSIAQDAGSPLPRKTLYELIAKRTPLNSGAYSTKRS